MANFSVTIETNCSLPAEDPGEEKKNNENILHSQDRFADLDTLEKNTEKEEDPETGPFLPDVQVQIKPNDISNYEEKKNIEVLKETEVCSFLLILAILLKFLMITLILEYIFIHKTGLLLMVLFLMSFKKVWIPNCFTHCRSHQSHLLKEL